MGLVCLFFCQNRSFFFPLSCKIKNVFCYNQAGLLLQRTLPILPIYVSSSPWYVLHTQNWYRLGGELREFTEVASMGNDHIKDRLPGFRKYWAVNSWRLGEYLEYYHYVLCLFLHSFWGICFWKWPFMETRYWPRSVCGLDPYSHSYLPGNSSSWA